MRSSLCVETRRPQATEALAGRLAELLFPGAVLALVGPLGAGKTCFVRGLARGLGIPPELVSSPTFVLLQEYPGGRLPLYHWDLYRLRGPADFAELGAEEYLGGPGICVLEWADRAATYLPPERLEITLSLCHDPRRQFTFTGHGPRSAALVQALATSLTDSPLPDVALLPTTCSPLAEQIPKDTTHSLEK
jgi:tRNA threonylcarbamoyladenosine biosynthesis protein TsaE